MSRTDIRKKRHLDFQSGHHFTSDSASVTPSAWPFLDVLIIIQKCPKLLLGVSEETQVLGLRTRKSMLWVSKLFTILKKVIAGCMLFLQLCRLNVGNEYHCFTPRNHLDIAALSGVLPTDAY